MRAIASMIFAERAALAADGAAEDDALQLAVEVIDPMVAIL
jgi:hypothetical protein